MSAVWIVDDDQSIRWVLERALRREGYTVRCFERAADCLQALTEDQPQVLMSDIRMPGGDGIDMLRSVKEGHPGLPVVIMTAFSDLGSAVSAFQQGAYEYLAKPFDLANAIDLIRRAVDERGAAVPVTANPETGIGILGQAPAMQELFRAIGRLSQSPVTVLITGESGTGKELVARALHRHSPRADKPFVALNTAAIPQELLESELFGHERGSFTGAQQQRRGRFEQADGGSLFLDEIGDMPAPLQSRLLRVLSDGQFYRVGGVQSVRANVRVIAATHQALEDRVRSGEFREDLFHRLNVIRLRLPALRERREDIGLLARHFLTECAAELGGEAKQLDEDALAAMAAFEWPGNVRQLENTCRWLTVMAPSQRVGRSDLPPELQGQGSAAFSIAGADIRAAGQAMVLPAPGSATVGRATADQTSASDAAREVCDDPGSESRSTPQWSDGLYRQVDELLRTQAERGASGDRTPIMTRVTREFERTVLTAALRHTHGRRADAAKRLGIGRNTMTRKIQELGLDE